MRVRFKSGCIKIIVDHLNKNVPKRVVMCSCISIKELVFHTAVATTVSRTEQEAKRMKDK